MAGRRERDEARRARVREHHGSAALAVWDAWRAVRRPRACARYVDGVLAWCEDSGDELWVLECDARYAAELHAFTPPLPKLPRNVGIYAIDLKAEERRSGVPVWFMPSASRRRRAHAWTMEGPEQWVRYVGHVLHMRYAGRDRHHRLELVVYLREGEHPFEPHHSEAVWELMTGLST